MNVTLPNGVVMQNVPEGTSRDVIAQKAISAGLAKRNDFGITVEQQEGVVNGVPVTKESITAEDTETVGDSKLGAAETGATIASSIVAEPISGLAGILGSVIPGEEGQGAEWVEKTKQALTYQPKTELGRQYLQSIGETLAPVAEGLETVERTLGEKTLEATGSPELAAIAHTLPTALLEAIGVAGGKAAVKTAKPRMGVEDVKPKDVKQAIVESAPSVDQIKEQSRALYKSIDDSGAKVSEDSFLDLAIDIDQTAKKMGSDSQLTPKAQAVVDRFEREVGATHKVSDIDTLRKVANNAAKSTEPAESAIGVAMVDKIDDYLDRLTPNDIRGDIDAKEVGKTYRKARELWSRNRKNDIIQDAFERAELQASGFENGLRTQFRQILSNKKKSRAFTDTEKAEMKKIVEGTKGGNAAKFLGKFGMSEGQATSTLGAAMSGGAGFAAGGPLGAAGALGLGQFSKNLSQRLTRGNAQFADSIVRAGRDGEKIANAYLKYTPKGKRSASELQELFLERKMPREQLIELKSHKDKNIAAAALATISALKRDEPTE